LDGLIHLLFKIKIFADVQQTITGSKVQQELQIIVSLVLPTLSLLLEQRRARATLDLLH
jgi:hypothetical protein